MATKRTPSAPGEVDKLIAHQARLLKAPRITAHYHRLAEQGRAAGWSMEDYLGAVLAVEFNARAESVVRQRIRYVELPAIKTITDFDFTVQPAVDRAQIARLEASGLGSGQHLHSFHSSTAGSWSTWTPIRCRRPALDTHALLLGDKRNHRSHLAGRAIPRADAAADCLREYDVAP